MNEHNHHHHTPSYYIKIWGLLLVLLAISVIGPTLEIPIVTLITAFGIAFVKAYIVASRFMHLNIEKKIISYMLLSFIVLMLMFFFGTSADIMRLAGENWHKL